MVLLVISVAGVCAGLHLQGRREAARREMMNNFRALSLGLGEFESEYGTLPDGETLRHVCKATGNAPWPLITANDYFRQLVASGLRSEIHFSDGGLASWSRRPDRVIQPLSEALAPGECAFTYVLSVGVHPSKPVLLYPVVPGTLTFDPAPLGGKALVLRSDGSMSQLKIEADGRVLTGGKDYFDPSQPMWGGKKPDLKYPAR